MLQPWAVRARAVVLVSAKGGSARVSSKRQKFALLRASRRVWALSSIHGDAKRLVRLHQALGERLKVGDRLVYLGNMIGRGARVGETVDELLLFRREFLSVPRTFHCDIAYLRGSQEEMWQKLLQLQFAADARSVLEWMLEQGLDTTLRAYGIDPQDGLRMAGTGPMQVTRWTGQLRRAIQARPGHYAFYGALRRAAYTDDTSLLFVNAGLDPSRPIEAQRDSFWWVTGAFGAIVEPYAGFRLVVRGFAPHHPGLERTDYTATLDAGCGFGGPLMAACFLPSGEVVDQLEA